MSMSNNPCVYGMHGRDANRLYGQSHENVQQVPNTSYDRTSASSYGIAALPSQEFAQNNWPPSVYEAAQYPYHTPLTLRQRCPVATWPEALTAESWQASCIAAPLCYQDQSRNIALPQMASIKTVHSQNPQAMTENGDSSSEFSPFDPNAFAETAEDRYSPEPLRPHSSEGSRTNPKGEDVQGLHCSVCGDTTFTGYCAQRNYNRHMERHKSTKSIRCSKPECTKTFGRGDALLIHLRRSHPELNIPPAKKRKYVESA